MKILQPGLEYEKCYKINFRNILKKIFLLIFIVEISYPSFSQIKLPSALVKAGFKTGIGTEAPFWLFSNRYGVESIDKNSALLRVEIKTDIQKEKQFDYSYGIDILGRYGSKGEAFLHQAYIQGKVYFLNILAGKKEEIFGNQDSTLSIGGLLWSGNAQPIPGISVYINDYLPLPLTKGFLDFKGGISHGWFGDQPYVVNAYLHHKYIYFRFGGNLPLHLYFGYHDYAQWGGNSEIKGKQPHNFKAFIDIFFAKKTDMDTLPDGKVFANTLGNHIGNRNFGFDIKLNPCLINVYWQNIFEDGSGMHWQNISDGLWGVSIKKTHPGILSKVLFEFLHTTNQSGPYNWDSITKKEYNGNDNYFNHGLYRFGWTYNNYTIGTPLITSPALLNGGYNDHIRNNKIISCHMGIEGLWKFIDYKVLYTYSINYGTNNYPQKPSKNQHSFLLNTKYSNILPYGINLEFGFGMDIGKMYGNNTGFSLTIEKKINNKQ